MTVSETTIEPGIANVFADLGLPDADVHLVKVERVTRIDAIVRQRGITQAETGRLLGLARRDVSRLLRGDFREYSLERLLCLLTALGRDVDVVIRQPRSPAGRRLLVAACETAGLHVLDGSHSPAGTMLNAFKA